MRRLLLPADRRGLAALEFALCAPVLLLVMLCSVDIVLWLRSWMRLEQTADEIAQVVSQCAKVGTPDLSRFFSEAQLSAGTLDVTGTAGAVFVTAMGQNSNGNPVVFWQSSKGNLATYISQFGAPGGAAVVPSPYVVPSGQVLIGVEVYNSSAPWVFASGIMKLVGGSTPAAVPPIYSYQLLLVRSPSPSNLDVVDTAATAPECGS